MNFNQATFKSVVIVSLLGAAILPPPFLVAATAVSESKYGPPESEGRGGFGGEGSSLLLFEQVNKVAGTKDHDVGNIGKGGKALDVVIGGGHDANQEDNLDTNAGGGNKVNFSPGDNAKTNEKDKKHEATLAGQQREGAKKKMDGAGLWLSIGRVLKNHFQSPSKKPINDVDDEPTYLRTATSGALGQVVAPANIKQANTIRQTASCPALCPDDNFCKYRGGGVNWNWRADCHDEGYENIMRERDSEIPQQFDSASEDACRGALEDMKFMGIDVHIDDATFSSYEYYTPPGCYVFCNEGILYGHFNSNAWNHAGNNQGTEDTEPLCQRTLQRDLPLDNLYWLDLFKDGQYYIGTKYFTYSDDDCPWDQWEEAQDVNECKDRCVQTNIDWDRTADPVPPCTSVSWDPSANECALRKCLLFPLIIPEISGKHEIMAQKYPRYNQTLTGSWIQDYTLNLFDSSPSGDSKCLPGEKFRRIRQEEGHQSYGSYVCETDKAEIYETDLPRPNAENPDYRETLPVDFFWDKNPAIFEDCWEGMSDAINQGEFLNYWFAIRLDYEWQQHYFKFEHEFQRRGYDGVNRSFELVLDQTKWLFQTQFQINLKVSQVVLQREDKTWPDNPWRPGDAGVMHFTGRYNGGGGRYNTCQVWEIIIGGEVFKEKASWEPNQDYPKTYALGQARTLAHELGHHFGHGHNPAYIPDIQGGEGLTSYRRCEDPSNPGQKKVCGYRSFQKFTEVPPQHNYYETICKHLRSNQAKSCGVISPLVPSPSPPATPAPPSEYCPLLNGTSFCPDGSHCKYKGGGLAWDWRADCKEEGYVNIMRERDSEVPGTFGKASEDACRDALTEMQSMGVDISIGSDVRIAGSNSADKEPMFSVYLYDKPSGCYVTCDGGQLQGFFNSNAWNYPKNPWEDAEPLRVQSNRNSPLISQE